MEMENGEDEEEEEEVVVRGRKTASRECAIM
jgi:hypothetical protein